MPDKRVRLQFQPSGRTIHVLAGTTVIEATAQAGLTIQTPCGGAGTCGKCRIQFTAGACEPSAGDKANLSAEELADGWRFACQTAICDDCTITIPQTTLFASQHQILTETSDEAAEIVPAVRKVFVELSEPTLIEDDADLYRLEKAIGEFKAPLSVIAQVRNVLRSDSFSGTAVLADHHLIGFEAGDTSEKCYGVAFDVGTTTVVGSLLDLRNGEEVALASGMNPQTSFGDDVISRINYSAQGAENLDQLRQSIVGTINNLLDQMCAESSVARGDIYEFAFAGNTTMEHLLCGLDVEPLGRVPFTPAHARALSLSAEDLGIRAHPEAAAYVFPVIGGFVGGDTVACMLSSTLGAQASDDATLLVDIGTNGEIVLAANGKTYASSTAAGPAFEGARISCGMRATNGAIAKIVMDTDLHYNVIGNVPAVGLCGSSLVDLSSGLLTAGIIDSTGRLLPPDELPADLPEALAKRLTVDDEGRVSFLVASDDPAHPVSLTERDVREMQLACGAIRAGITILMKKAGIEVGDISQVLLAGGFASFIRRSHALRIGLLPGGIDHSRIHYVGNASLTGARWALLSTDARQRAERCARKTEHVELSQDLDFQMQFAECMIFPED